ncbi:Double-stranded RNA-binding protein [Quillaja saponaria]|uniref:Double-stranded RNA-binding protein n=1 Tax=Quillaja saponaria TaxID=32244 RepID=A0AAD7LWW5_QUISA|nr:Double-stranded RNA-binding protein [Quillaja saponaria]
MPTNEAFQGVSNCYVFKSRLQEYAQKVGLPTPVYDTIKEGPSHQPSFRSTVIVNDIRYDSLPGFLNRKAAEQSAAEVALMQLAESGGVNQCISQPVHETGLCKNLLQEYAQKMNYAMPLYQCQKDETPGRAAGFSCTVEIGGIRYIGAAARTKKEAEIKAARTALLAIRSSPSKSSQNQVGHSELTVIPVQKRGIESVTNGEKTSKVRKSKKPRFKKNLERKLSEPKPGSMHNEIGSNVEENLHKDAESKSDQNDKSVGQTVLSELMVVEAMSNFQNELTDDGPNEKETTTGKSDLTPRSCGNSENEQLTAIISKEINLGSPLLGTSGLTCGDTVTATMEGNTMSKICEVVSVGNDSISAHFKVSSVVVGLKPAEENIQPADASHGYEIDEV